MFDPVRLLLGLVERLLIGPLRRGPSVREARDGAVVIPFPSAGRVHITGRTQVEDCD